MTEHEPYTDTATALRAFALDVYHADGVPTATLLLQDRAGLDVNVVLLAAFVGSVLGRSFDADDVAAAHRGAMQWQTEVVRPLRAVRRRLKDGPAPAPTAATTDLRDRIKALELDAEMIELDQLGEFAAGLAPARATGSGRERAAAAMRSVLAHAVSREPTVEEADAIDVIAAASCRGGRG